MNELWSAIWQCTDRIEIRHLGGYVDVEEAAKQIRRLARPSELEHPHPIICPKRHATDIAEMLSKQQGGKRLVAYGPFTPHLS